MKLIVQESIICLDEINQLYPAAVIKYEDGSVTPISLEWFDEAIGRGEKGVTLLRYAIYVHYKEKEREPSVFFYEDREALEREIGRIADQIGSRD
ncbi:hypothetical protein [Hydrogenimonas sp.]